jgi:hypothetical protein
VSYEPHASHLVQTCLMQVEDMVMEEENGSVDGSVSSSSSVELVENMVAIPVLAPRCGHPLLGSYHGYHC